MAGELPRRVLVVGNCDQPPAITAIADAFSRIGAEAKKFFTRPCNTVYDRFVIHTINHYAHTLRLVPKSVDLFKGHPKSHLEYRNSMLVSFCRDFKPDLVFLTRGLRYTIEAIKELREMSTVFCWYTESEKRYPEVEPEIPYYHHTYFFSTAGLDFAAARGCTNVSLLQHAVDTSKFRPLDLPKVYDWCFVGQWHQRRQQYLEGLAEVSKNFVIYGPRWRRRVCRNPSLWLRIKGKGIWEEKLTRLYNQTKVVVNVNVWGDEQQVTSGVNLRLLEVPACRTCLLTDYSRDAERLLSPGVDFVSCASVSEMQQKLTELLADDGLRSRIAQSGYEKAAKARTYDDMVAQICADWVSLQASRSAGLGS
jgi:spore maturation protein CgeB